MEAVAADSRQRDKAWARRFPPVARMWTIDAVLLSACALLWLRGALSSPRPAAPLSIAWPILAALWFLTSRWSFAVRVGQTVTTTGLVEIPLVLGLLFSRPLDLALACIVGNVLVDISRGRREPWRVIFNTSVLLAATGAAVALYSVLPAAEPLSLANWLWITVAILGGLLITDVALPIALWAWEGDPGLRAMLIGLPFRPLGVGLGLLSGEILWHDAKAALLLAPPLLAGVFLQRTRTDSANKERALTFLGGVDDVLRDDTQLDASVLALLNRLRTVLNADTVQLTLRTKGGGNRVLRTTVRSASGLELMKAVEPAAETEWLLSPPLAILFNRESATPDQAVILDELGHFDGMAVAVGDADSLIGGFLIAGHTDSMVTRFTDNDLQVLRAAAQQAARAFASNWLQRTIEDMSLREAVLTHRAFHDPLTGLPNRDLFEDRAVAALARQGRTGGTVGVLFLDLDGFKPINDRHGHDAGDALLRHVADRLRSCLRDTDTAARMGGDEFAILLENLQSPETAELVIGRIQAAVVAPLQRDGVELSVGVSIGRAMAPPGSLRTLENLLAEADADMYRQKEQRRAGRRVTAR